MSEDTPDRVADYMGRDPQHNDGERWSDDPETQRGYDVGYADGAASERARADALAEAVGRTRAEVVRMHERGILGDASRARLLNALSTPEKGKG